jgi:hypothetical protein
MFYGRTLAIFGLFGRMFSQHHNGMIDILTVRSAIIVFTCVHIFIQFEYERPALFNCFRKYKMPATFEKSVRQFSSKF